MEYQEEKITENFESFTNVIMFFSNKRNTPKEENCIGDALVSLDFKKTYNLVEREFLFQTI